MPQNQIAELLVDSKCILAEGIQWNEIENRLYWCDIHDAKLWSSDEDGGNITILDLPDRIGSFAFDKDGNLLIAFVDGLYKMKAGTTDRELIEKIDENNPVTRLNDGRCDRQGRFVVGGMDEENFQPLSQVFQYDGHIVKTLITNVSCSNAICFSPDGKSMYFADSPTRVIRKYQYEPETGKIGNKFEVFAELAEHEGVPDGSCVDVEGGVWNTRFGGSSVQRYLPDGTIDVLVSLPVSQLTCCCIGGKNMNRLFISSAKENLTEDQLRSQPLAGGIFVANSNVSGINENRFGMSLY